MTMQAMKYLCPNPHCQSEHVQTFRMAFESGTSHSHSVTTGFGVASGGGFGVGTAQTSGASMSILAQKVAPPMRQSLKGPLISALLGGFMAIKLPTLERPPQPAEVGYVIAWTLLLLGVFLYVKRSRWNKRTYPKLMDQWEHSWICHKCGNTFRM